MRKWIKVSKKDREDLKKIFKVTERTVFNALGMVDENNDLHKRIRKAAIEHGGEWVTELPVGETIHLADGTMRQELSNGAVVEFYRNDNTGKVFFKGKEVRRYEGVNIPMIFAIQAEAAALR